MKIIIVSDLHLDDDPRRINWLAWIIDQHQPHAVFSLGDNGVNFDHQRFKEEILGRCRFYSLYGNHEDMKWLTTLWNSDGTPVLLRDGKIIILDGLRLGFINGIISQRKRTRKGVPRKTPDEYLKIARKLTRKVDILCIHEFPAPDELAEETSLNMPAFIVREAVQHVRPKVVLCGHIHYRRIQPQIYHIGSTRIIVIDSTDKYYVLLDVPERQLELKRDHETLFTVQI